MVGNTFYMILTSKVNDHHKPQLVHRKDSTTLHEFLRVKTMLTKEIIWYSQLVGSWIHIIAQNR